VGGCTADFVERPDRRYSASSLGTFLARLGWTRIGSPGILGVRTA